MTNLIKTGKLLVTLEITFFNFKIQIINLFNFSNCNLLIKLKIDFVQDAHKLLVIPG
jgi:hypothetical protein